MGRSKGKITIEFATVDDLERIVGLIESGQLRPEPNQVRPEPNQVRPEANQMRPEPNLVRSEPVEGHTIDASTSSAHTEPNQYRQSDIQEDVGAGATASA